jgi:hypothetical protein
VEGELESYHNESQVPCITPFYSCEIDSTSDCQNSRGKAAFHCTVTCGIFVK